MKNKKTRLLSLMLCLALCLTLCIPALAANESNAKGVTFSAVLDQDTLEKKNEDQTVSMTIKASKVIDFDSIEFSVICPDGLTCEVTPGANDEWNAEQKIFAGMTDHFGVTDIEVVKFTIPANTTGQFTLSVEDLYLTVSENSSEYYTGDPLEAWEDGASVSVTLTVTDDEPAGEGYTASVSTSDTAIEVGETMSVSVSVAQKDADKFAASELIFSYDKDKLTYTKVNGLRDGSSNVDNDETNGILTIEDCGGDKDLGEAYEVVFTAKATGSATVTLTSAAFSDKVNAEKADLIAATINPTAVTSTISQSYAVTLPAVGYVHGNDKVAAGGDYTLSVDDYTYYNYTVTATMGGETASVIDNKNGTYTVKNVSGALEFNVSRQAKQYDITFTTTTGVTGLPTGVKGTYGMAYSGYTVPAEDHWSYSVTSVVYTGTENAVAYSVDSSTRVLTIAGDKITAPITITIDKVQADATVSVVGSGASDATGYTAYATPGEKYTLNVTEDLKYDYTVTATVNSNTVTVTKDDVGKYSIAGTDVKAGAIVFTVNKTMKTTGLSVSEYLQLDGTKLWLVKNTADKLEGEVYTFEGVNMFWNETYGAYCTLVISGEKPTVEAGDLDKVTGTVTEIRGYDVNMSGQVDANDAQLIYNMFKAMYSDYTADVTMQKFLLADVNADGVIDMIDVVAVINYILA